MFCNNLAGETIILTADGGELTYQAVLHGLTIASSVAQTPDASWTVVDLAKAIWESLTLRRLSVRCNTTELVDAVRRTLGDIGFGELAPHFHLASAIQYLSLEGSFHEPPLKDEADFRVRVRNSIRGLHLPGVRTLYVTGLPVCESALAKGDLQFPGDANKSLRSRIVASIRWELQLLTWNSPFECYLS